MINVGEYLEYRGGNIMSTMGVILSTVGDTQYRGGYHDARGGYHEYHGVCSTSGDTILCHFRLTMKVGLCIQLNCRPTLNNNLFFVEFVCSNCKYALHLELYESKIQHLLFIR